MWSAAAGLIGEFLNGFFIPAEQSRQRPAAVTMAWSAENTASTGFFGPAHRPN